MTGFRAVSESLHQSWASDDAGGFLVSGVVRSVEIRTCIDRVWTEDVEGDGRAEIVVARWAGEMQLFSLEGTPRPGFSLTRSVTFVERLANQRPLPRPVRMSYGPPFRLMRVFLTDDQSGRKRMWIIACHGMDYPSVLLQLEFGPDRAPRVVSEYWSPGYITAVSFGTLAGRSTVLVGACHNESGGASLAVFRGTAVNGSAPSPGGDKECLDCPEGRPDDYFVFPRSPMLREQGAGAKVTYAVGPSDGGFSVSVMAAYEARTDTAIGMAHYVFDRRGALARGEVGEDMTAAQRRLTRAGAIPRGIPDPTDADLFPVLHWTREHPTFEKIPKPVQPIE